MKVGLLKSYRTTFEKWRCSRYKISKFKSEFKDEYFIALINYEIFHYVSICTNLMFTDDV